MLEICCYMFNPFFMLTDDQVRHVAKLARLHLTDQEVQRLSGELSKVLDYVDLLSEVDTDGVEPTYQVTGLQNVSQTDEVKQRVSRTEMLECSALPKELNQIRVKAAIKD